jgi:hypothetical protein
MRQVGTERVVVGQGTSDAIVVEDDPEVERGKVVDRRDGPQQFIRGIRVAARDHEGRCFAARAALVGWCNLGQSGILEGRASEAWRPRRRSVRVFGAGPSTWLAASACCPAAAVLVGLQGAGAGAAADPDDSSRAAYFRKPRFGRSTLAG